MEYTLPFLLFSSVWHKKVAKATEYLENFCYILSIQRKEERIFFKKMNLKKNETVSKRSGGRKS